MNNQEAKEILNKPHVCREAEKSIRDMKIKLSKFKGDSTSQTKHLQNLDNLLNLSHKQAVEIEDYSELTARYIMKIGEINSILKDMTEKYYLSEQINEIGIDEVVRQYQNKINKT
jgi:hypothetical protein|tara:strand:- start:1746 stop:2090 length:345 start_codon:yes stop_codon:yes gene_type:complete